MKFESLLARRYIFSQKRHSLLTICSIVIAVALMTMIFTSYTTLKSIQRASHYDSKPYHMEFHDLTETQADLIGALPEVDTFEKTDDSSFSGKYRVRVMFGAYLDEEIEYIQKLVEKTGIEYIRFVDTPAGVHIDADERFNMNDSLMRDDLLTLSSRYSTVIMISLLCVFVLFLALALRLIIDTAFEVSSKERERQFGVLQSVGATPKQIVKILTHEGLMLSVIGVPLGALAGIGLGFIAYKAVLSSGVAEVFLAKEKIEQLVHYYVSPLMVLFSMLIGTGWVWISAYSTGMRIIKMTPIQAISNRSNTIKKVKKLSILGLLFGWKGKLAARNARRQPKRFIVTVLSLTLSLTLFASFSSLMESFATALIEGIVVYDHLFGEETSEMTIGAGPADPMNNVNITFTDSDDEPRVSEAEMLEYYKKVEEYQKNTDFHDAHLPVAEAEKLIAQGCFDSVEYYAEFDCMGGEDKPVEYVAFVNEAVYNRICRDNLKTSFADFEKSGKALLINSDYSDAEITVKTRMPEEITKAEYEQIRADNEKEDYHRIAFRYGEKIPYDENGEPLEEPQARMFYELIERSLTVQIGAHMNIKNGDDDDDITSILVLPYSYYEQHVHEPGFLTMIDWFNVTFKDDASYNEALTFLNSSDEYYTFIDVYKTKKEIYTIVSAVRIAVNFGNIMLALIAIVNMVNIVSTGILNRKSELGSLQCIGMTRGQETAVAVFECVQFVIFSGIAATILVKLLMIGATSFISGVMELDSADIGGRLFQFGTAFAKICGGTAVAFLVALISSIIPLHIMNKQELVDQIRTVE